MKNPLHGPPTCSFSYLSHGPRENYTSDATLLYRSEVVEYELHGYDFPGKIKEYRTFNYSEYNQIISTNLPHSIVTVGP